MRGAVTVLARIFHVDGNSRKILDHDFARQPGMTARSAGSDDQLLEGQQRALNREQFAGEKNVVPQMQVDGFSDGLRLLIDFPEHGMGKPVSRGVGAGVVWIHVDCGESKSFAAPGANWQECWAY